jgi:F-type H+-transporting ATPase subunit b
MDEILHQLGQLFLGAVPTVLIFIFLVVAYRTLVFGPLMKTLAERRARTEGAVESAHAAIAAADAKAQEYEAKLRAARSEIFHRREQRVQQWNAERETALDQARQAAQERVIAAQSAIHAQTTQARQQIDSSVDQLAAQILQAILPAGMAPAEYPR